MFSLISSLNQGTKGLAGMVFVMSGACRFTADARVTQERSVSRVLHTESDDEISAHPNPRL